jgi:proton-coupled amino acid transporter
LTSFLGLVAWLGSASLDKVVSVVGCFACIPLSFIYPALFHSNVTESKLVKFKDWVIVLIGTLAMIYTTSVTIREWATNGPTIPHDRCHDAFGNRHAFAP